MSTFVKNPASSYTGTFNWKSLYRTGGVASLLQLAVILAYMVVVALVGPRITSAGEFFAAQQAGLLASLLRVDLFMLLLVGLYLFNFPALLAALWRVSPLWTVFATLFTLIGVIIGFTGESTFALLYLGRQYAAAASEAERVRFLVAGDALLAGGWWNSTASYIAGIMLQGSGVIISLVMLRSRDFSKLTAISGLLGNAIDLVQHLIHPFAPAVSEYLKFFMVVYFVWYAMLGRDLFRLARRAS